MKLPRNEGVVKEAFLCALDGGLNDGIAARYVEVGGSIESGRRLNSPSATARLVESNAQRVLTWLVIAYWKVMLRSIQTTPSPDS